MSKKKQYIDTKNLYQAINQAIQIYMEDQNNHLSLPIQHAISTPGKRVRPLLLLLAYQLFKQPVHTIMPIALSIEILHNFTLIHDDIMDKALLRRGQSTVHAKWNTSTAILTGDMMLCHSFRYFATQKNISKKLLKHFCKCIEQICNGQQKDMLFEKQCEITITEKNYIEMITQKTAHFLGFCMQTGGILAKTSTKNIYWLYQLGLHLGIIFQLQDDFLDLYGNYHLGKKLGGDIVHNKKTFLYIKAFDLANDTQKNRLKICFNEKNEDDTKKIAKVKAIFDELNLQKITQAKINLEKNKLKTALDNVTNTHPEAKKFLEHFITQILARQK